VSSHAFNNLVKQTIIPNARSIRLLPIYAYVGVTIDTARNSQNQRDRMVDDIIGMTDTEWTKIKTFMEERAYEHVTQVREMRLDWICELDTLRVFHEQ
jgi:hypothetical protein